ncbi:DUF2946 family protein [Methylocella sp.]|uniref:DUF2946 family protein n=1 Tax=Methylocella sp. TaxID=1978226 RepID=UPI0035B1525C
MAAARRAHGSPRRKSVAALALALVAWIAILLAPLRVCAAGGEADAAAALSSLLGDGAPVVHCSSRGHDGDHAPDGGQSSHDDCPGCCASAELALTPDWTPTTAAAPAWRPAAIPAPVDSLHFAARPRALAGRPRAPPSLI